MKDKNESTQGDDMVGKLIAAAGRGQTASAEARERVYGKVRARWESEVRRKRPAVIPLRPRKQTWLLAMAAGVTAVAVGLTWVQNAGMFGSPSGDIAEFARVAGQATVTRADNMVSITSPESLGAVMVGDTLTTGSDGRVAMRRPDGLMLRVNVASRLTFTSPEEIELLSGTVYIDTGNNASAGDLRLDTPRGVVEHLGTQYEARIDDDESLRVRVREGRVSIGTGPDETLGVAGEELAIDAAGQTRRATIAPDDAEWNWAVSLATLPPSDEYLVGEALAWVAREMGLTLDYSNALLRQRLAARSIVGLDGLDPAETLEIIESYMDVVAETDGSELTITE